MIRDLKKCKDNTQHNWCDKFNELVQKAIYEKKEYTEKIDEAYINKFDEQYEDILYNAIIEHMNSPNIHYDSKEKVLIRRILKYKDNYFLWMYDFSLPTDDNLSERALRGIKSKMKIAGQFQN